MLVQRRRDTRAALRLMRKLLKKQGFAPKLLVTDKLRSYASAFRRLRLNCPHACTAKGGRIGPAALQRLRELIDGEHPDRAALRHIGELPCPNEVQARLHTRGVDPPARLHRDVLLAVDLERHRQSPQSWCGIPTGSCHWRHRRRGSSDRLCRLRKPPRRQSPTPAPKAANWQTVGSTPSVRCRGFRPVAPRRDQPPEPGKRSPRLRYSGLPAYS
jgi:DDE domain